MSEDRFTEVIRKYYGDYQGFPPVIDALCDAARRIISNRDSEIAELKAEVARMTPIEDAARAWDDFDSDYDREYPPKVVHDLVRALRENPSTKDKPQ